MFEITKEIGIDAAHRVPLHESKCRNLHGHRYVIQATVSARNLQAQGSQTGMVMDFGFLKELMIAVIDKSCDHGTIVWIDDTELVKALRPTSALSLSLQDLRKTVETFGSYTLPGPFGKTLYVPFVPTAENLAQFWFDELAPRVLVSGKGHAELARIRVWETPSSCAEYPML